MTCLYCNGYVPLPETTGEQTYCTQCGRGYALYEREEIWYETYWEKYKAVDDNA
jgi:hypothetical protein